LSQVAAVAAVAVAVPVAFSLIHPYPLLLVPLCPSLLVRVAPEAQTLAQELAAVGMAATLHLVLRLHSAAVAVAAGKLLVAPVVPVAVADKTAMQIPVPHHKDSKVAVALLQSHVHLQVVVAVPAVQAQWALLSAVPKPRGAVSAVLVHQVPSLAQLCTTPAVAAAVPITTQQRQSLVVGAVARRTTFTVPVMVRTVIALLVEMQLPTPEVVAVAPTGKQQAAVLAARELLLFVTQYPTFQHLTSTRLTTQVPTQTTSHQQQH
jgi:hypothetical protein